MTKSTTKKEIMDSPWRKRKNKKEGIDLKLPLENSPEF